MKKSSRRRSAVVIGVALLAAACTKSITGDSTSAATIIISNITASQCTHIPGDGVSCALTMDIGVNHVTFKSGTATFVTTSLLVGQYINVGVGTSYNFPQTHLRHSGAACITEAQTTLAIYDGPTFDSSPLVATAQIGPITLGCN